MPPSCALFRRLGPHPTAVCATGGPVLRTRAASRAARRRGCRRARAAARRSASTATRRTRSRRSGRCWACKASLRSPAGFLEKAARGQCYRQRRRGAIWPRISFSWDRLEKARANLQLVLRQQPTDAQATLLLGMVSEELRDDAHGAAAAGSGSELVAQRPQSIIALARVLLSLGHVPPRRRPRCESSSSFRDQPDAVLLGAQAAMNARDWPRQSRCSRSIAERHPDQPKVALQLALAQYRNGHPTQARETLSRLLAEGHESADAFNLLGWCFFREGNVKDAIASLDLAIDREPGKAAHYIDVGLMLFSDKRYGRGARSGAPRGQGRAGLLSGAMLEGLAQSRLNRLDEALASYRKAKELQPAARGTLAGDRHRAVRRQSRAGGGTGFPIRRSSAFRRTRCSNRNTPNFCCASRPARRAPGDQGEAVARRRL